MAVFVFLSLRPRLVDEDVRVDRPARADGCDGRFSVAWVSVCGTELTEFGSEADARRVGSGREPERSRRVGRQLRCAAINSTPVTKASA